MVTTVIYVFVIALLVWYVWNRLARSNVDPLTLAIAERRLSDRAALHFAIDNDLPINPPEK